MKKTRKKEITIIVLTCVLVLFTRALTVTHNMYLHSDEHVFFQAAQNLKGYLFGNSPFYEEVKEYPEGAIVLQLPFHILTAIINRLSDCAISPRLSGRLAAVVYFTLGSAVGCALIRRFLSDNLSCMAIFGLTTVFGLMNIEQSRYGTGDAISFFLLMVLIFLSAESLTSQTHTAAFLLAAAFVSGMLCAVKYPLLFFFAIPLYALLVVNKKNTVLASFTTGASMLVALYIGFAVLSPKAAFDPGYIIRASTRELDAYVGTLSSMASRVYSNFMCITAYALLYSGIPFMPLFAGKAVMRNWNSDYNAPAASKLFTRVIPILAMLFFLYNLFVAFLAVRTFYPFFLLCDIYAAVELGEWLKSSKAKRTAAILLTGIMLTRGAYMLCALSDNTDGSRMANMISQAVNDNWCKSTILSGYSIYPDNKDDLPEPKVINITDERFSSESSMQLDKGELFIAGAREHTIMPFMFDFLPSSIGTDQDSRSWVAFKEINSEYYIGRLYPEYYYYLFGHWLKCSTGSAVEFPTCEIYYRG